MSLEISRQYYNSTFTGNATARTLTFGFKPIRVTFYNITDGDSVAIHVQGMTAATNFVVTSAVALNASEGVTLTNNGCTLGTHASVNESGKVFRVVAE